MNDQKQILISEIEIQSTTLIQKIPLLIPEINKILLLIEASKSVKEDDKYLELLKPIYHCVCQLIFIKKIEIPDELFVFFKDFDSIDFYREYLLSLIKKGEYSLIKGAM